MKLMKKRKNKKDDNLKDINNSPIQLIDQLKGYYYINPLVSLSLAIDFIFISHVYYI